MRVRVEEGALRIWQLGTGHAAVKLHVADLSGLVDTLLGFQNLFEKVADSILIAR